MGVVFEWDWLIAANASGPTRQGPGPSGSVPADDSEETPEDSPNGTTTGTDGTAPVASESDAIRPADPSGSDGDSPQTGPPVLDDDCTPDFAPGPAVDALSQLPVVPTEERCCPPPPPRVLRSGGTAPSSNACPTALDLRPPRRADHSAKARPTGRLSPESALVPPSSMPSPASVSPGPRRSQRPRPKV